MNLKYDLVILSDPDIREFKRQLVKLGYKGNIQFGNASVRTYKDGSFLNLGSNISLLDTNFKFKEKQKWEFDAALAIAAIWDDNEYHENEWVVFDGMKKENTVTNCYTIGSLYQLGGTYWEGRGTNSFKTKYSDKNKPDGYDDYQVNYHKACPEEIIAFFKQKYDKMANINIVNKEVIGYRIIKDGPGFAKGLELTVRTDLKGGERGYQTPVIGGPKYRVKFPDEILADTQWFEPIYKDIIKEKRIEVGTKQLTVTVTSDGKISIPLPNTYPIKILALESFIKAFNALSEIQIGDFAAYPDKNEKYIRIGCETQNNRFSYNEIVSIINAYKELNP